MSVSDDFNRADAANLGANWTELTNGAKIVSNRAVGDDGSYTYQWVYWSANTWNNNQSSQCVVGTTGTAWDEGPVVRVAAGVDGYLAMCHSSGFRRIYRRDDGSFTLLANFDGAVASGDTIKLDANGSTLEYFRNAGSLGTTSDATYASGAAGISVSNVEGTNDYVDEWVGTGEVAGGGGGNRRRRAIICGAAA
jgi:hypothetical protein